MTEVGYLGDQVGQHKGQDHKLVVARYGANGEAPESICVECECCNEVVAELFNGEPEPGQYDQFKTECPICGGDDIRVIEVTLAGSGEVVPMFSRLESDGFELPEGIRGSTEDEQVKCRGCEASYLLSYLTR